MCLYCSTDPDKSPEQREVETAYHRLQDDLLAELDKPEGTLSANTARATALRPKATEEVQQSREARAPTVPSGLTGLAMVRAIDALHGARRTPLRFVP